MTADGMVQCEMGFDFDDFEVAPEAEPEPGDPPLQGEWRLAASAWVELEYPHYGRVLVAPTYECCPVRKKTSEDRRACAPVERTPEHLAALEAERKRQRAWLDEQLKDPYTHRYGRRFIPDPSNVELLEPPSGLQRHRWRIKVMCECGDEQTVPVRDFILKHDRCGRQCRACNLREVQRLGFM